MMNLSRAKQKTFARLQLATWNVNKLRENKSAIFSTLSYYGIDIACLQETGLTDNLIVKNATYILKSSGIQRTDQRLFQGVGIVVRRKNEDNLEVQKIQPEVGERIMYCTYKTDSGLLHIINVYAPTAGKESSENDIFYKALNDIVKTVSKSERLFILGDFNAHVGAGNKTWDTVLGPYGIGVVNSNGRRLLEFCKSHNLCITNTHFDMQKNKKFTFYSRLKKTWHELDLIVTRPKDLKCVDNMETCIYLEHTDHCMVICNVRFSTENKRNQKSSTKQRADNCSVYLKDCEELNRKLSFLSTQDKKNKDSSNTLTTNSSVCYLEDCQELGRLVRFFLCQQLVTKPKPDKDVEKNWIELQKAISKSYTMYKLHEFVTLNVFYETFKIRFAKFEDSCINYNSKLDEDDLNDRKQDVKKVLSVFLNESNINDNQNKSIIRELDDLLTEMEKVSFNKKKDVVALALKMNWTQFEKLPTVDDLMQSIELLENNIQKSVSKGTKKQSIITFLQEKKYLLHSFLSSCWKNGHIPMEMCFARIICYKYHLEPVGCNSFSGINIISIISDVICSVIERRFSKLVPNKSTITQLNKFEDMMTSLKLLQAEFTERHVNLIMAFVDMSEVLDQVNRSVLLNFFLQCGCSSTLVNLIAHFINVEKNDDTLSVALKNIFIYCIFEEHFEMKDAICIQSKAPSHDMYLNGIRCDKKMVILATSSDTLRHYLECTETKLQCFKLSIITNPHSSTKRATQIMVITRFRQHQEKLTIGSNILPFQKTFNNWGVLFTNHVSLDIKYGIREAKSKMLKLKLYNTHKSKEAKISMYNDKVFKLLLHHCKFRRLNTEQQNRLQAFHIRSIQRILGIEASGDDSSLLYKTGLKSVQKKMKEIRKEEHLKMTGRSSDDKTRRIYFWRKKNIRPP